MRRRTLSFLAGPLLLVLAACDDPVRSLTPPVLVTDTVTLGPPSSAEDALPSAVDLSSLGGGIGGARFPERQVDAALGWDLALRATGSGLVFLPAGTTGVLKEPTGTRTLPPPGVTQPRSESFEEIREAPVANSAYVRDAAVPVVANGVYVARTRTFAAQGSTCFQYAKIRVLDIVPTPPSVRLEIVSSALCGDTRLVSEED